MYDEISFIPVYNRLCQYSLPWIELRCEYSGSVSWRYKGSRS